MKFIKTNWTQKLIIILVAIILFNAFVPPKVKAGNLAGALMKPAASLILSILVSIDVSLGVLVNFADMTLNGVGKILNVLDEIDWENVESDEEITDEIEEADKSLSDKIKDKLAERN